MSSLQLSPKRIIDFSPVLHIVLYFHLHCGHFIDLKSYFVLTCYNFVNFNQIHWKRRQLEDVILAGIKLFIPAFIPAKAGIMKKGESNAIFAPLFRLLKWPL